MRHGLNSRIRADLALVEVDLTDDRVLSLPSLIGVFTK